ncbi:MAG TPA: helix-turn-helix domain-containing protein [Acidimicrobiales bacterium]|nr:helix-turn-helix domain-containing protein [Acidimicrobiales bacterium]
MPEPVKTKFPRREKKARATRLAILAAARQLFVAGGYGATTIQAIADEADVAVQTVYAVFGNKRAILAELVDDAIAGDDAEIVVNDREWMRPVWEAPTAAERLQAYAAAVRRIMDRAADVFAVVAAAATTDPDAVELADTTETRRRAGATSVIESVRTVCKLRPGLSTQRAIDLLWLLNSPAVYTHLVRRAGWTPDQYEAWLAEAMVNELLSENEPPGSRSDLPAHAASPNPSDRKAGRTPTRRT